MNAWSDLDAPTDVSATIEWLIASGFDVEQWLTRDQPNGNKLVRLRRGEEVAAVVRDRGQWEFTLRGDGWAAGLHNLHEASTGEVFDDPPGTPLPQQHPSDRLPWADAVPAVFAWRERTPDWRSALDAALVAGAERIQRRLG